MDPQTSKALVPLGEVCELQRARAWKGIRYGSWADERHERLMRKCAEGRGDGMVREADFVKGLDAKLPHAQDDFVACLTDLMGMAEFVAQHKAKGTWGKHAEMYPREESLPITPVSSLSLPGGLSFPSEPWSPISSPTWPQGHRSPSPMSYPASPGSPFSQRPSDICHSPTNTAFGGGPSLASKIAAEHGTFQSHLSLAGLGGRFSLPATGREGLLQRVYRSLDFQGDGAVPKELIDELGKARRILGQELGSWGENQNNRCLKKLKPRASGAVTEKDFVSVFIKKMPHDLTDFEHTLREFHEVAEWIRLGRPLGWDPKLWDMPPDCGVRSYGEMRRIAEEQARAASPSPLFSQPSQGIDLGGDRHLLRQMALRNVARVSFKVRREHRRALLGAWRRKMLQSKYGAEFNDANPKAHFFDDWIHHVSRWEEKWRHVDVQRGTEKSALLDASLCKAMEQVGVATMEVERALRLRELDDEDDMSDELSQAAATARESAETAVFQAQEARSYADRGSSPQSRREEGRSEPCHKQTAVGAMAEVLERAIAEHTQLLTSDITGVAKGPNPYSSHTDPQYIARQERLRAELVASGELDFLRSGVPGVAPPPRWGRSSHRSSAWTSESRRSSGEESSLSPEPSPIDRRRFSNEFSWPSDMASPPPGPNYSGRQASRSASADAILSDVESALLTFEKEFGL